MNFFCVFGSPINHSISPRIHNNAIQALGLDGVYLRYELKNKAELKEKLFSLHLSGVNITVPYKEEALKIADFKDEMALKIGSSNTLVIKNKKIHAYNTDAPGFLKAIKDFKGIQKALILGAGGTAKALAYILKQEGIEVFISNRSEERLKDFKAYKNATYANLNEFNFDLIINTTPAGLVDENLPCDKALLEKLFNKAKFAFDAVYGRKTPFLNLAKEFELSYKDGTDMLLWQGVFAFELFFELKNKQDEIYKAMKEALSLT